MTTIFITATGTDIGKTFVTAAIARMLRGQGLRVRALKPVASGFAPETVETTDTGVLALAQGLPLREETIDALSPWRFAAPLSPDMAAAREGRSLDFAELLRFTNQPTDADVTLVEGIGGVMVPLDETHTVLDWIAGAGAPVLLVAGSYLGTLSHTLTSAGMLIARECPLAGIVVSESAEQPVALEETAQVLRRFLPGVPVVLLPRQDAGRAAADPELGALLGKILGPNENGPAPRFPLRGTGRREPGL